MLEDTEIKPSDSGMCLPDLHNLLRDVLRFNPNRNKNFLMNKLKIKPLIEVSKHSFDDGCSPLAIIDFKLLQEAYQHYSENPDCLTQEALIPSISHTNEWKDRVFISHRDSNAAGTSEDNFAYYLNIEKVINNISDPEGFDLCNEESMESLFNKPVPWIDLSPSVTLSPFQTVLKPQGSLEKVDYSKTIDLTRIEEKDQTDISKYVRRRKTLFGKRKKCRKKNFLVRNENSTDSSEMLSPPSEIHVNELEVVEKGLCVTEELSQDGLSTQEQKIDSTVFISPTSNAANVSSSQNKNELRKRSKPNSKARSTKKEIKKCKKLIQSFKEMPNPTKSLQTEIKDGDKNQCQVLQISEKKNSGPQDVFPASEGHTDQPSTIPKPVLRNQSPTISSRVVDPDKQTCKIGHETPKSSSARTEMKDKLDFNSKSPKSKSNSKEDTQQRPSEMLDNPLNSRKTLKAKSSKSKSTSKEDTQQIPCEVNSGQTLKVKSPISESSLKEDVHQRPSEMLDQLLNSSQPLIAKSPRSKTNPKEDTTKLSCDTVKDSLSLQTEAVKFNAYAIEKESEDGFDHLTPNLSDSGFTESEKDGDKNSNISISPLDHSNYNGEPSTFYDKGNENQRFSRSENQQEVDENNAAADVDNHKKGAPEVEDHNNMAPEVEPPKLNGNFLTETVNDDNYDLLDYECDDSDLDDTLVRKSPEEELGSYFADEDIHSTEEHSCYSEVTGGDTPGQEMCPTSEIISSQLAENVSCLRNPQETNYNEVFKDHTEREEIGVARKVPWNPPKARKRRMSFSDDDDSSASDSEKSYKRRKDSSPSQLRQENIRPSSCSKLHVPEPRLRNFDNVIRDIQISCDNHNILKAVNSASEYLKISDRPTCIKIFQELFLGIRDSVRLTSSDPEDPLKEIMEKLKSFVDSSNPKNLEDIKLCSMVIYEYFQVPVLIRYALDLCCHLQKNAVPIRQRAVDAYANNAISRKAPTDVILNFLTYIKKICRLLVHQPLLRHVLQRVVKGKECYMLPEFSQLCDLLCLLDAYEIERQPLQGLIKICIENNCWDVFARLFIAWCDKQCFPTQFLDALQLNLNEIGIRFKKFAAAFLGAGEPSESSKYFFGIIGVTLIMDSCEIGREKDRKTKMDYLVNANHVLRTLHKYNVDIFRVTESFFRTNLPADPDPCLVLCFPYSVYFNLVEICLRLNLPKDAFQLHKNYSSYLSKLPHSLSDEKKSCIRIMQFEQFIRVTHHLKDPLESRLSAFHSLMLLSKHEDILNALNTSQRIDVQAIVNILANLMVSCMNKFLTSTLYQLYQYMCDRPWEPFLMSKKEIVRGLLVTFVKCDKMEEARSLFTAGWARKFYQFERPIAIPWEVTLLSCWTNQEMKFVVEKYLHLLYPFLSRKKSKIKFEAWYTVKITFKEYPSPPPKISCLIVPSVPTSLSRGCSVITSIDPDLRWTEHENFILLTPSTVYNHWINVSKKSFCKLQEKTFNASQSRPLVFGTDVDNEANLNFSRTPESPAFSSDESSPSEQSTPSCHYQRPLNDLHPSQSGFLHPNAIQKRNASFNSQESSSPHTPECRTSVDREPSRPGLRSFERRGSSCESGKVDNESPCPESPASKRQRISRHQPSPRTGWNQLDRNPSYQLPPQTGWNQFDRNASHQSPGRNRFNVSKPNNFAYSRTSPRQTPQQSTTSSYQLPLNTGLDQSQSSTPPLPHSGERFRSPVRQDRTRNNFIGLHTDSSFTVESHQLQQNTKLDRSQNKSSFTQSLGKMGSTRTQTTNMENFRVTQPAQFDSSDTSPNDCLRPYKNISSRPPALMSPPNHFAIASPYPSDESELSVSKVKRNINVDLDSSYVKTTTKSPLKQVTRNILISSVQNADLSSKTFNNLIASQKNNCFVPINDEPTTSLKNHSPGESLFRVPQQKSNLNVRRKLNLSCNEPSTPKSKPYRIQTPCKEVKVIRPITPVVKSGFRCKTSLMSNTKMSQNFKQSKATKTTKRCSNGELGPITVSFGNNSSRTITAPRQTNFRPPAAVTSVPPGVFQRITTFIKSQILLKCKSLSDVEIQEKVTALAKTFVKNNSVTQLDGKTMKLLCKFVETIKK